MIKWLNKILGKEEENGTTVSPEPQKLIIPDPFEGLSVSRFGRYSDNNKTLKKTQCWYKAEDLYKEKKYNESLDAFFNYLKDEGEDNVIYEKNDTGFTFELSQGSRKVYGESDGNMITARVPLAIMEVPGIAIMRRLLDLNYSLYYSRTAKSDDNTLYMVFDTEVTTASPNKMYYGLRELATKADRHDDLLLEDFDTLKLADKDYTEKLTDHELEVKYKYFRKWILETLTSVDEQNQDSFSGAIAYMLLGLVYRIDFMISPESKLLSELEQVNNLYWEKKDEIPLIERNKMMKNAIRKLLNFTKEDFAKSVYRSKGTFAISTPPKPEKVREYIINANKDGQWYVENKYADIAIRINEYGVLYSQFVYSMPKVQTDLTTIYMAALHPDFFEELGLKHKFYDVTTKTFNEDLVTTAVDQALKKFRDKFSSMRWEHSRVHYDNIF